MERTIIEDSMFSEHSTVSDAAAAAAAPINFPSEVVIEGQHMQKVCVRFQKPMLSSRLNSPSTCDFSVVDTCSDTRLHSSTRITSNEDDVLPFPQEESRTSSMHSDNLKFSDADNFSCAHEPDFDGITKAKEAIQNGVTNLEKQYDLVNSRLRDDLCCERKQCSRLQQVLDDVIVEKTKLESENARLRDQLTRSKGEIERLQQKEVIDLKTRFVIEEELIKLRSSEYTISTFEQLRTDLRETKAVLEKVTREKLQLESQLRKLASIENGKISPRLPGLPTPPGDANNIPWVYGKSDEAVVSNGTVTLAPLSERLKIIRHENSTLLSSTLPALPHVRRQAQRRTLDVISLKTLERSVAGAGMPQLVAKHHALSPTSLH